MKKRTSAAILMETLKELMRQRDFRSITVADILEASGLARATFYKHFTDKYALLAAIFHEELVRPNFSDYSLPVGERETEAIRLLLQDRAFYLNAVKEPTFLDLWYEQAYRTTREYLLRYGLSEDDLHFLTTVMAAAFLRINIDCLKRNSLTDADRIGKQFERLIQGYVSPACC